MLIKYFNAKGRLQYLIYLLVVDYPILLRVDRNDFNLNFIDILKDVNAIFAALYDTQLINW